MIIFEGPECISDDIVKYNNFWEFDIFNRWKSYFPSTGLMLDIGANIGGHCVQFKHFFPKLKIVAFEPHPDNFALLKQNTDRYSDVAALNVGVGSRTSIVSFDNGHESNSGVVRIVPNGENKNIVFALDDIHLDERVNFIKIDIEGHEVSAFEGMVELIKKDEPLIWLEDNTDTAVRSLIGLGYEIIEKDNLTPDFLMRKA
jgi:FkbM family methyltransferase